MPPALDGDEDGSKRTVPQEASDDPDPAHSIVSPVNSSWRKGPLSPQDKEKIEKILAACRDRDLEALAHLATSQGGLIEDELRRTACMNSHSLLDSAHAL